MSPPPNPPAGNRPPGRPGTGRAGRPVTGKTAAKPGAAKPAARPGTGAHAAPPPPPSAPARTTAGDNAGHDPTRSRRGLIGVGMIAAGVGCALLGGWIAWAGWVRWDGIDELKTAWSMQLKGEEATRRQNAHRAAAELPNSAAAVLMDSDFTSDDCDKRLDDLMARVDSRDKSVVATAQALAGAMKGVTPTQDVGPGDGEMLAILASLERGEPPRLLPTTLKGESHQSVQAVTFAMQFQAAMKAGDPAMIRQAAGMIALAMPAHPQAPLVAMIATMCDDKARNDQLDYAAGMVKDANESYGVLMNLVTMIPARADQLTTLAYGGRLGSTGPSLDAQVNGSHNIAAADFFDLAERCIAANRFDLAKNLMAKLTPAQSAAINRAMNLQSGDLATLLATKSPELRPRITAVSAYHHGLAFQLSNDAGVIPTSTVTVMLGGEVVPKARVVQLGTLYSIAPANPPKSGAQEVEIHAGDAILWHGSVNL